MYLLVAYCTKLLLRRVSPGCLFIAQTNIRNWKLRLRSKVKSWRKLKKHTEILPILIEVRRGRLSRTKKNWRIPTEIWQWWRWSQCLLLALPSLHSCPCSTPSLTEGSWQSFHSPPSTGFRAWATGISSVTTWLIAASFFSTFSAQCPSDRTYRKH